MSGTSMFDAGGQPNLGKLPLEGGTLENATPIEAIVENAHEERSNDVSEQHIEEIVKELDEGQESSSAAKHSLEEEGDNPYMESVDTANMKEATSSVTLEIE